MTGKTYRTVVWIEGQGISICNALRPDPDDPAIAKYTDRFKATCFFLQDWPAQVALTELSFADDLCDFFGDRRSDGAISGTTNVLWIIDAEEEKALVALNEKQIEAKNQKNTAALEIEKEPIKVAQESGVDQVDKSWMENCDGSEPDCSMDSVARMVRPDGTMYVTRTHCF